MFTMPNPVSRWSGFLALALLMAAAIAYWLNEERAAPVPVPAPAPAPAPPVSAGQQRPDKNFDFYVLSLSWSPTYCLSTEGNGNKDQCGASKRYGLVAHGLWPQYERGYPEFCSTNHSDRVPESLGRRFLDIMPSIGLIGHEWRKHGTCSGLNQEQYLQTTRRAFEAVQVPDDLRDGRSTKQFGTDEIETLFTAANPGLDRRGIAVTCEGNRLDEIRICLTTDLEFRTCPEVDKDGCKAATLGVPAIR
ncbi:ribonuclease [Pseudomonas sp. R2.Fl]|nr:ribonuclease [Pseudomonas sp. R2.Fl]